MENAAGRRPLIVVPTFRERDNLPHFTERVWKAVPESSILVVDDFSGDGTPGWVAEHGEYEKRLFILERPGKMGLGSAYRDGFRWALDLQENEGISAIVQLDADLSHDPATIPAMLTTLDRADVSVGTRYAKGGGIERWSMDRLMLSRFAAVYVRVLTGMPLSDPTGGFKAFRPDVLRKIDFATAKSEGYAFQIEMNWLVWRAGYRIEEVPIIFGGRQAGMSKITGKIVREAVWRVPWLGMRGLFRPRAKPESPL